MNLKFQCVVVDLGCTLVNNLAIEISNSYTKNVQGNVNSDH